VRRGGGAGPERAAHRGHGFRGRSCSAPPVTPHRSDWSRWVPRGRRCASVDNGEQDDRAPVAAW